MKLRLAPGFALPLEFVTESTAILGIRRSGKSNLAKRLVEELHAAQQQVVVLDPKGDWWGLRSSADGKAPGVPIIILGGEHGDVPLEVGSGELVARLIVEQTATMLLDLSKFRKHEVATFTTGLLETLYRLKGRDQYRTPLTLVVDEADEIAPQRPFDKEQRMLGAAEDVVRRGGQRGLGIVLISQRAAVLNKNVLTQCGILMLLRTTGSQDIDAVDEWIKKHGQQEARQQVMATIAAMARGTAWVWAPGWPDEQGIFRQVAVPLCRTFDSGATPKPGQRRILPKTMADVDLAAFAKDMAATIERSKQENPQELRRQVADLQKQVRLAKKLLEQQPTPAVQVQRKEVRALKAAEIARLEKVCDRLERLFGPQAMTNFLARFGDVVSGFTDGYKGAAVGISVVVDKLRSAIAENRKDQAPPPPAPTARFAPDPSHRVYVGLGRQQGKTEAARLARAAPNGGSSDDPITGPQQRILDAAAFLESLGIGRPEVVQLALFAGQSATGGYWRANIGRLRTLGLMDGVQLTDTGRARAQPSAITTVEQLHEHVFTNLLEGAQRPILRVLIEAYPDALTREELGKRADLEPDGGYWRANIGRLRSLGLITKKGPIAALPVLFLGGA